MPLTPKQEELKSRMFAKLRSCSDDMLLTVVKQVGHATPEQRMVRAYTLDVIEERMGEEFVDLLLEELETAGN